MIVGGSLSFDLGGMPAPLARMIMAKAESAGCSPSQAIRLLLNELASKAGFTAEHPDGKEAA